MGTAAVVANFSGGEGTTLADQFRGKAGDGWAGAWNTRNGSNGTTTFSVLDTNPFDKGGKYLQVGYQRTALEDSNRAGVARAFETSGPNGINLNKNYKIAFDFRPDVLTGWETQHDQFAFSSETSTTIGSFGANSPWSLLIRADEGWIVTNGNGSGGITNINLTTALGLEKISAGTVYQIVVEINPTLKKYDLTITTGGVTYRASEANGGGLLGFRTDSTANTANVLQFRTTNNLVGDNFVFSLDNIEVIPEPGSVAMVVGGIVALGLTSKKIRLRLGR